MCAGAGYQAEEVGRQTQGRSSYNRNCSDDQKEKCREAAKARRSKETEYFKELENLLPIPNQANESEESHFDKISLIRFSIAYLKTREIINNGYFTSSFEKEKLPNIDILSCLDGFTLVLSPCGVVIYASDNITTYLGISTADILGQPFLHYVHPCDHQQLKMLTCHKGNKEAENHLETLARVKCLVTERGRMVNLKQARYKTVKINGKTQQMNDSKQGAVFIGIARVVGQDGADRVFSTKHRIDMRFSEADTWLSTIAGYSPHYLVGISFYVLLHPQDSQIVQRAFKHLSSDGVCETAPYRLLCSGGGLVWVQTVARVVCRRAKQGQAVVCRHHQISGVFDRGVILSLNQLDNQRKSNETKRDHRLVVKKNQRDIIGERIKSKTCNLPAGYTMETTEYATRQGIQNPIKSFIPVIIDRRQNSDKKINDDNMKLSTEGHPKCVTSNLFENLESLYSKQRLGMEFVPQTNYPIILEKNEQIMNNAQRSKETYILDDDDFFRNFQQLEESIQMEDLEQLSPHSGYESVTFNKSEDFEFLDFLDPAEFEHDCQAKDLLFATSKQDRMQNVLRKDQDKQWDNYQVNQVEQRKSEDRSYDKDIDDNNIGMNIYSDDFLDEQLRYNMWQNPWTHSADRTCGTSYNQKISDSIQNLKNKQNKLSLRDCSGTGRKREHDMASSLGGNFKKMRFDSNMQ